MGLLEAISKMLGSGSSESHSQGENWADRVFASNDTIAPEDVVALGQEYSSDPTAFYNGYRKQWNKRATVVNEACNIDPCNL